MSVQIAVAARMFEEMNSKGIRPNVMELVFSPSARLAENFVQVVTFTALMKGYCTVGEMGEANKVLEDMSKESSRISPNIRTINTFLRSEVEGCEGRV